MTNAKNKEGTQHVHINPAFIESWEYDVKSDLLSVNLNSGRQHQLKGQLAADTMAQLSGTTADEPKPA